LLVIYNIRSGQTISILGLLVKTNFHELEKIRIRLIFLSLALDFLFLSHYNKNERERRVKDVDDREC
jgi:positive regulator of sigma E activity